MKRDPLWTDIAKDKVAFRRKAAAKSFEEKLRIVEKIRDRDAAVRAGTRTSADDSKKPRSK